MERTKYQYYFPFFTLLLFQYNRPGMICFPVCWSDLLPEALKNRWYCTMKKTGTNAQKDKNI